MSMPFYVSPEQVMKDRADYARKGIARGRSLVALECPAGVLIVADNPSRTLSKISEIYDRIAFAAVGKYNEFQMLRVAGVRHADMKGFSYSRDDVSAKELANAYAQTLGQVFTHEMKPYEVELLVAEVGHEGDTDAEMYHLFYDGVVIDERRYAVLGGMTEQITEALEREYTDGMELGDQQHEARGFDLVAGHVDVDPCEIAYRQPVGRVECASQLDVEPLRAESRRDNVGPEHSLERHQSAHPHHGAKCMRNSRSRHLHSHRWSAASSASRTNTASPAPCAANAAS